MLATALTLFAAGLLTILLPCILPLIPIVLGVSIAGRSKWRPLLTVAGMVVSFVGFTFLLQVVLSSFIELADTIRIATYYVLLLFGVGFLTHSKPAQIAAAVLGALFFVSKGWLAVGIAAALGVVAMEVGGRVATAIQQLGTDVQSKARTALGDSPLTAFVIGLTMGMVWVPCAGPALGFAFTLVREQPGFEALLLLLAYASGTAVPLLAIGYGGQAAVHSVRALSRYTGRVKQVAGALLVVSAIAFQLNVFTALQTWLVNNTSFGTLGTDLEEALFGDEVGAPPAAEGGDLPERLPDLGPAPTEFPGLGPWHNAQPLTMNDLKGKVVLVDFWTYSCINCIRTLPYIQGYWDKYKDAPFVLLGVHSPEFVFEKSEANVKDAIARHGLTYPVAQDNDFLTWRAFQNRYWPAKYLIDAEGRVRYRHFGEGAYDETDRAIASLLAEIGVTASGATASVAPRGERMPVTPETYLGERSWQALANAEGGPDAEVHDYVLPETLPLHSFALGGRWQVVDEERQVLRSESGEIRIRAQAGEVNLVLGLEDGATPATATVLVDGKETSTFTVDRDDLYVLYDGAYGEHEIALRLTGPGVSGYAYTFGQ